MLGRRGYMPDPKVNSYINFLLQYGVKNGILPPAFLSVVDKNAIMASWQDAIDDSEGYEFITFEKWKNDGTSFVVDKTQLQALANNTSIVKPNEFWVIYTPVIWYFSLVSASFPQLNYNFYKIIETWIRNDASKETREVFERLTGKNLSTKAVVNLPTNNCACPTNGLAGGTPPAKDKTWVKPLVVTAIIGTAVGVGLWKKDEIMKAITGKKTAVNGLNGAKRKRKTVKGKKKGLGQAPNKGLRKMKEITKIAKELQNKSGYEKRKVKEMEIRTVEREMPKLSWKDAQKKATYLVKNKNNPR